MQTETIERNYDALNLEIEAGILAQEEKDIAKAKRKNAEAMFQRSLSAIRAAEGEVASAKAEITLAQSARVKLNALREATAELPAGLESSRVVFNADSINGFSALAIRDTRADAGDLFAKAIGCLDAREARAKEAKEAAEKRLVMLQSGIKQWADEIEAFRRADKKAKAS